MKVSIYNYPFEELVNLLEANGFKKFRAAQVFDFLYNKKVKNFSDMYNVSSDLIIFLDSYFVIDNLELEKVQKSKDGTTKFLYKLSDGNFIESVVMPHDYGLSICISSEVGCAIGCKFCASGILKKDRSLLTSEMVLQILESEKNLGKRISSVVIMGIGEPFLNFDNVISFIKIINDHRALNLGARKITVSTSGIIPKMKEFADLSLQSNLAISFHSPFNDIRSTIMPINNKFPINDLIIAIKYYLFKTGRRVAIEYLLIDGINDRKKDALELVRLFKGMNVYFNLIPYNEVLENDFKRSKKENMLNFLNILKENKFNATLRKEFGHDIDAACGQLRAKNASKSG